MAREARSFRLCLFIFQYIVYIVVSGSARWQCGLKGEWRGKPDLSDCVSPWMEDIREMVRKVFCSLCGYFILAIQVPPKFTEDNIFKFWRCASSLHAEKFFMTFCASDLFLKLTFSKNYFMNTICHQSV